MEDGVVGRDTVGLIVVDQTRRADPFGRTTPPVEVQVGVKDLERARRVRLLAECFTALIENRLPSDEARLFTASGGLAWLQLGGAIDKDYWKVRAPNGSHHSPRYMWRLLRDASLKGETPATDDDTIDADNIDIEGSA